MNILNKENAKLHMFPSSNVMKHVSVVFHDLLALVICHTEPVINSVMKYRLEIVENE